jgi:hypothetical protein
MTHYLDQNRIDIRGQMVILVAHGRYFPPAAGVRMGTASRLQHLHSTIACEGHLNAACGQLGFWRYVIVRR